MILKSSKHDINLNTDKSDEFEILKVYDSACLLRQKDSLISALAAGRKILPDSYVLKTESFKNIFLETRLRIDSSQSIRWNSRIKFSGTRVNKGMPGVLKKVLSSHCGAHEDFLTVAPPRLDEIIGKGPGLTPAGDDFIVGALNASACFSADFFKQIKKTVIGRLHRTSRLSRHFITIAAGRRAGEVIKALLSSLSGNDENALAVAARQLLSYGSFSGHYTLQGLLWALKKIN